jgi:hypothetical protein
MEPSKGIIARFAQAAKKKIYTPSVNQPEPEDYINTFGIVYTNELLKMVQILKLTTLTDYIETHVLDFTRNSSYELNKYLSTIRTLNEGVVMECWQRLIKYAQMKSVKILARETGLTKMDLTKMVQAYFQEHAMGILFPDVFKQLIKTRHDYFINKARAQAKPLEGGMKLRDVQRWVAERYVKMCPKINGFIVYHTMGSGKTLIGLAYMANYTEKKVVVTPNGLEVAWKKDINNKRFQIPRSFQKDVTYLTYSDLNTARLVDIIDLFKNAIVCFDEAHILITILRRENSSTIRACLLAAKKIILLTGTPNQTGWGDLGVLLNICNRKPLFPGTNKAFFEKFKIGTYKSSEASSFTKQFFKPNMQGIANFTMLVNGLTWLIPTLTPFTGMLKAVQLPIWVHNYYIDSKLEDSNKIDPVKIYDQSHKYITYFNYNDLEKSDQKLIDYPYIQFGKLTPCWIALTPFQLQLYMTQAYNSYNLQAVDFDVFGDISFDVLPGKEAIDYNLDFTNATVKEDFNEEEFIKRMRVLGNLNVNSMLYKTVQVNSEMEPGEETLAAYGNRKYARVLRTPDDYISPDDKKECDAHRARIQSFLDKTGYTNGTVNDVLETMGYECPKFNQALTEIMESRIDSNFLPVVYTNYDKYGLQSFSAYLTQKGYPHIIIHPNDPPEVRTRLVAIANLPHRKYVLNKKSVDSYVPVKPADYALDNAYWNHRYEKMLTELNHYELKDVVKQIGDQEMVNLLERLGRIQSVSQIHYYTILSYFAMLTERISSMIQPLTEAQYRLKLQIVHEYERIETLINFPTYDELPDINWNTNTLFNVDTGETYTKLRDMATSAGDKSNYLYKCISEAGDDDNWISNAKYASTEVPLCVLLHPDIREGISFDLAPKIVCLEVPYGLGNQEQIYARVLRSCNALKRKLAFIDGSFRCPTNVRNENGLMSYYSINVLRARPWRVTKSVIQLVTGEKHKTLYPPKWIVDKFSTNSSYDIPMPSLEKADKPVGLEAVLKKYTGSESVVQKIIDGGWLDTPTDLYNYLMQGWSLQRKEYLRQQKLGATGQFHGYFDWADSKQAIYLIRGDEVTYQKNLRDSNVLTALTKLYAAKNDNLEIKDIIDHKNRDPDCNPDAACEIWNVSPPDWVPSCSR